MDLQGAFLLLMRSFFDGSYRISTMGCSPSKSIDGEDSKEATKQNASIDKMLRMDKKKFDRTIKILLLGMSTRADAIEVDLEIETNLWLGAGESGKSTIIKQMRIIHSGGFPDDERRQNRAVIYSNIIIAFKILLDIMDTEQIPFEKEETKVEDIQTNGCTLSSLINRCWSQFIDHGQRHRKNGSWCWCRCCVLQY